MKKFIYLDIDGVLCLGTELAQRTKYHEQLGWLYDLNKKAVSVLNKILDETQADIIISSDWKDHFTIKQLGDIFEYNGVKKRPIDVTVSFHGKKLEFLERDRVAEILDHVKTHKPDVWVAIDDLDLRPWITGVYTSNPEKDYPNFVYCSRFYEGIKQTGKSNEIIKKLNINND
jgi:hypothetical protein